jgi:hypothetical protein
MSPLCLPLCLSLYQWINFRFEILTPVTTNGCDNWSHWSSPAILQNLLNVEAALSSRTSLIINQNAPRHILEWNHFYMSIYLSLLVRPSLCESAGATTPSPGTVGLLATQIRFTRFSLNLCGAKSGIWTKLPVFLKLQDFSWDVMPYSLVDIYQRFGGNVFNPDDEGSWFLWNISAYPPNYIALHSRRL